MVVGSIDKKPVLPKAAASSMAGNGKKKRKDKKPKAVSQTSSGSQKTSSSGGTKKKKRKKQKQKAGFKMARGARPLAGLKLYRPRTNGAVTQYFKVSKRPWRPGRPYAESYWTLGDERANFGPPGETLDRSVLKVLSYKFTIVAPTSISPSMVKDIDTCLSLPHRSVLHGQHLKPQLLVLNPEYTPGVARFSAIVFRSLFSQAELEPLLKVVQTIQEGDIGERRALVGLSTSGYQSISPGSSLDKLRNLSISLMADIRKRLTYVDQQTTCALNVMPRALKSLASLEKKEYHSWKMPKSPINHGRLIRMGTSVGVTSGWWGMTTFPGDSSELYSFIVPLCPAHLQFQSLGGVDLDAGDVVALLASEMPHALTLRPEEGNGYAVTCWTEDRMMRLIEYEEWVRIQG
ncbi:hypothetical protein CspHIS471_0203850 [Cutaneotrichosporon sp. HIS471]|nr:hypothetical protein CspHIS471_0203850 [Cutaneotrichosporon sp. HIS471]